MASSGAFASTAISPDDSQPHQARLVFWTHKSNEPECMDWELSMLDPAVKQAIAARFPAFHAPRDLDELAGFLKNLFRPVGDLLANFGFDPGSGSERYRLKLTFAMPPEAMFPAMDRAARTLARSCPPSPTPAAAIPSSSPPPSTRSSPSRSASS